MIVTGLKALKKLPGTSWTDNQRTQWFSCFIRGPAKATWHRTLSSTEKMSWKAVKKIYQVKVTMVYS